MTVLSIQLLHGAGRSWELADSSYAAQKKASKCQSRLRSLTLWFCKGTWVSAFKYQFHDYNVSLPWSRANDLFIVLLRCAGGEIYLLKQVCAPEGCTGQGSISFPIVCLNQRRRFVTAPICSIGNMHYFRG